MRFQSTLPRGERLKALGDLIKAKKFQSTLPRGERPHGLDAVDNLFCFNPRSRVGSDFNDYKNSRVDYVSIHAPAWGATSSSTAALIIFLFQSTLPRGERLHNSTSLTKREDVSIHAPAWGATMIILVIHLPSFVSIHAPAWGATISFTYSFSIVCCFNPRSRVGSDSASPTPSPSSVVSIHAPAWGATTLLNASVRFCLVSIHAPAWGATMRRFSLTTPNQCFNPRSRVGSDRLISKRLIMSNI